MVIDCHIHTSACGHADGEVQDYVQAAEESGVDVITFTEHMPLPEGMDPEEEYALRLDEVDLYVESVRRASTRSSSVRVLLGAEIDWIPSHVDIARSAASAHDFDMVLGSVHFLDDWAFDDPRLIGRWDTVSVEEVWEAYFEQLIAAAGSGIYDVMAHPDLVKKFGHRMSGSATSLYRRAAATFASSEVAIEVSSAGLRKPCQELYPAQEFLVECARHGVRATVGSDAHSPSEVGWGFDSAIDALKSAGYETITYFVNRKPKEVVIA
jgi:histidinol-phosphatase (PHP family)